MSQQSASGEQSERINVNVLFFGAARDASGKPEVQLSLPPSATARDALSQILETFPDLRRFGNSLLLAVNQEYAADRDLEVHDGDELALFPPVSGGHSLPRLRHPRKSLFSR
jgi:molybdopterin converting factor subunit 1